MVKWLIKIVDSYEKQQNHKADFNQLQWILITMFVLYDLDFLRDLDAKYYQILFRVMGQIPHSAHKHPHFSAVEENILKNDVLRKKMISMLKGMLTKSFSFKQPILEVLFSFPMLHFAQGLCVPFADPSTLPISNSDTRSALMDFKHATSKWYVKWCDNILHIVGFVALKVHAYIYLITACQHWLFDYLFYSHKSFHQVAMID